MVKGGKAPRKKAGVGSSWKRTNAGTFVMLDKIRDLTVSGILRKESGMQEK